MNQNDEFITVAQAAEISGRNQNTIYNWLQAGILTRYKSGNRTLIKKEELIEYLRPKPE